MRPQSDRFIKAAQLDALIAITAKRGEPIDGFPYWHVEGKIPTVRGAIEIARAAGVKVERKKVQKVELPKGKHCGLLDTTRRFECRVLVWLTGSQLATAALSRDPVYAEEVATGLAFRAGVEKLFC